MNLNLIYDYQIFLKQKYGGPSRYFVELNRCINSQMFNNEIFAPVHINRHLKDTPFNKRNFFFYKKFNLNNVFKKYNQYRTIRKIQNIKNLIVHATYYDLEYLRKIKCKKVVTVYDLIHEKFYSKEKLDKENLKVNLINDVDHFICISKNTQKDLIEYYNVDEKRTSVTYLSSTLKESNYNVKKKKDYFLFVGNRNGYKNFSFLVDGLSKFKKFRDNFDLYLFGGSNFSNYEISKFKEKGIYKNIRFCGNDESILSSLYKNASCFIYPSLYEGFGIPILEAMQNNCPVLCCDNPTFREIGQNSIEYFEPGNIESFIHSLEKIVYSNVFSSNLKNLGKKRRQFFSWQKCAKETQKIYLTL